MYRSRFTATQYDCLSFSLFKVRSLGDKIRVLHSLGFSYRKICRILKVSKGTVSYHVGPGVKVKALTKMKTIRNNNYDYIRNHKQTNACVDCREFYPYWIMELDHVRGEKRFELSRHKNFTNNLDLIKEEIDKCDVVCSNCHKNRTYTRALKSGVYSLDVDAFYITE